MTHFAKLNADNIVIFITVGRKEDDGKEEELSLRTGDRYIQTSYNTRGGVHYGADGQPSSDQSKALRKNYAAIGYMYDEQRDAFIQPKPYDSWFLDEDSCLWYPPVPYPLDENFYEWNETEKKWIIY